MSHRFNKGPQVLETVSRSEADIAAHPQPGPSGVAPNRVVDSPRGWRLVSWLTLAVGVVAAVRISLDSGVTLDEEVHRRYGEAIAAWFRSGFTDDTATNVPQKVYGGLFDLLAHYFMSLEGMSLGAFEVLHVFTALVALGGVVVTWKLAHYVGGPRAGFLAALFLALTPAWVGHGMFNPKDIPFAVGVALVLFGSARIAVQPAPLSLGRALAAGAFCGIALGVRPGGIFVLGFPLVAAFGRLALDLHAQFRSGARPAFVRASTAVLWKLVAGLAATWLVMISAWPWAQQDPLNRPFEAVSIAASFPWRNLVLFQGERIWSYELPWTYLPTWFAITLPELYLAALGCALIGLVAGLVGWLHRRGSAFARVDPPKVLCVALYVASVVAPLAGVMIMRPILYDAQRHFLFVLPPMAALAGIATAHVLDVRRFPLSVRAAVMGTFVGLACLVWIDMRALHPYQYVYFNRLFGGLSNADGRFETDYWAAANREGLAWVVSNIEVAPGDPPVRLATCSLPWQVTYYLELWDQQDRFSAVDPADADILVAMTRDNCHDKPGEVLHKVERQGVPLSYVIRRVSDRSRKHGDDAVDADPSAASDTSSETAREFQAAVSPLRAAAL